MIARVYRTFPVRNLAVVILLVAVLAGCGAGSATTGSIPTPTTKSSAPTSAATGTASVGTPKVDPSKPAIVFGNLTGITGSAAAAYVSGNAGEADAIRWWNEYKGGIAGHEIKTALFDTKYETPLHITGWNKLIQQDKVLAVTCQSSGGAAAVRPLAARDKTVVVVTSEPTALFPTKDSYTFAINTIFAAQNRNNLSWVKENWKGTARPRIGGYFIDAPPGHSGYKGVLLGMKDFWDAEPDAVVWSAPNAVDLSAQAMKLKQANLDYILDLATSGPTATFMKALVAAGVDPKKYLSSGVSNLAEGVYDSAGDAMIGMMGATPFAHWADTDVPGIKLQHELNAAWHPEIQGRDWMYELGWIRINVLAEATRRVIERRGYAGLTSEMLKAELESGKPFDLMGIEPPISYTPDYHLTANRTKIYRWDGGQKFTPVSGWIEGPQWTPEQMTVEYWQKD